MSVAELTRQALVLYVDGGREATDIMDELEDAHWKYEEVEEQILAGEYDDTPVPEGITRENREVSMGVVP